MQVHRRLVIHVQGYDARGLAENSEQFRREYRRTCELYGLTGEVGAAEETPDDIPAHGSDDPRRRLAGRDPLPADALGRPRPQRFGAAAWWKIVQMYRTTGISLLNGAFWRMLRTNWRFALVSLSPILLITAWLLLGSFVGILCMNLVACAARAGAGGENCRRRDRGRRIRLTALADRTADRTAATLRRGRFHR